MSKAIGSISPILVGLRNVAAVALLASIGFFSVFGLLWATGNLDKVASEACLVAASDTPRVEQSHQQVMVPVAMNVVPVMEVAIAARMIAVHSDPAMENYPGLMSSGLPWWAIQVPVGQSHFLASQASISDQEQ